MSDPWYHPGWLQFHWMHKLYSHDKILKYLLFLKTEIRSTKMCFLTSFHNNYSLLFLPSRDSCKFKTKGRNFTTEIHIIAVSIYEPGGLTKAFWHFAGGHLCTSAKKGGGKPLQVLDPNEFLSSYKKKEKVFFFLIIEESWLLSLVKSCHVVPLRGNISSNFLV